MANYLLISSDYRNRLLYPNPADFVVPFGSINNTNENIFNVFTTTNPCSSNFPQYNSCWTNFFSNNPYSFDTFILSGSGSKLVIANNVNTELLGINKKPNPGESIFFRQELDNCFDILRGFWLVVEIDDNIYSRMIFDYDPTSSEIILRQSFPFLNFDDGPIPCKMVNVFTLTPENLVEGFYVTVNGDFLAKSPLIYYDSNVFIYSVNQNEFRRTIDFTELFHKYKIIEPFNPNVLITDQFMLFSNINTAFSGKMLLQPNNNYFSYTPSSLLWFGRGSGYHSGMMVRLQLPEEESITTNNYFQEFHVKKVSMVGEILDMELTIMKMGSQEFFINKQYNIIPVDPIHTSNIRPASVSIGSFSLVFNIRFQSQNPSVMNLMGNYFFPIVMSQQYKKYSKNVMSFQPNTTVTPTNNDNQPIDLLSSQSASGVTGIKNAILLDNGTFLITTQQYTDNDKLRILSNAKKNNKIPFYCQGIDNFLILSFTNECVVPLNYSGSGITNSQMSCYELSITTLILPNLILQSSQGLLTSAYPYLFVEVSNETLPSGGNNDIIYSNNPFSTKCTFICSTSDVNNPNVTKFVKISSDGAKQIMKFSPYDNLHFRISLPNGETFTSEEKDFLIPNAPNPLLQIAILMQIVKM